MESGLSIKNFFLITMLLFTAHLNAEIIAVVDSGVDVYHEDLFHKIYVNYDEIRNNGVDDDGNHYIDDYFGWNFAEKNNQVIDLSHLGSVRVLACQFGIRQGRDMSIWDPAGFWRVPSSSTVTDRH